MASVAPKGNKRRRSQAPQERCKSKSPSSSSKLSREPVDFARSIGAVSCHPDGVQWSQGNMLAFMGEETVKIIDMKRINPDGGSTGRLMYHGWEVQAPLRALKVDLLAAPLMGLDIPLYSRSKTKARPTTNFRSIRWSPWNRGSGNGGCLLGALTDDHNAVIFAEIDQKWCMILDVSNMLHVEATQAESSLSSVKINAHGVVVDNFEQVIVTSFAWLPRRHSGSDPRSQLMIATGAGRLAIASVGVGADSTLSILPPFHPPLPLSTLITSLVVTPYPLATDRHLIFAGTSLGEVLILAFGGEEGTGECSIVHRITMSGRTSVTRTAPVGCMVSTCIRSGRVYVAVACGADLGVIEVGLGGGLGQGIRVVDFQGDGKHPGSIRAMVEKRAHTVRISGVKWVTGSLEIMTCSRDGTIAQWKVCDDRIVRQTVIIKAEEVARLSMKQYYAERKDHAINLDGSQKIPYHGIAVSPDGLMVALSHENPVAYERNGVPDKSVRRVVHALYPLRSTVGEVLNSLRRSLDCLDGTLCHYTLSKALETMLERNCRTKFPKLLLQPRNDLAALCDAGSAALKAFEEETSVVWASDSSALKSAIDRVIGSVARGELRDVREEVDRLYRARPLASFGCFCMRIVLRHSKMNDKAALSASGENKSSTAIQEHHIWRKLHQTFCDLTTINVLDTLSYYHKLLISKHEQDAQPTPQHEQDTKPTLQGDILRSASMTVSLACSLVANRLRKSKPETTKPIQDPFLEGLPGPHSIGQIYGQDVRVLEAMTVGLALSLADKLGLFSKEDAATMVKVIKGEKKVEEEWERILRPCAAMARMPNVREHCPYCREQVKFSNPFMEKCSKGHVLLRCRLSFLLESQEFNVSRCEICLGIAVPNVLKRLPSICPLCCYRF